MISQEEKKYLVLDDVVYSTHFTAFAMLARLYIYYSDNPDKITNDNKDNVETLSFLLNVAYNDDKILNKDSIFNMMITRTMHQYFTFTKEFVEWMLSHFDSLIAVETRESAVSNLVGVPGIYLVYDDTNLFENLIMKKLNIFDKVPRNMILTGQEFLDDLEKEKLKNGDITKRPSIFTANENLINEYGNDFGIITPANYPWIINPKVTGTVECWALEKINKENNIKEDKNDSENSKTGQELHKTQPTSN